ncbi:1180_t:CDS:2, partial [Diversispora eburnea]
NDKDTTSENAKLKAKVVKLEQKQLQTDEEKSNRIILRINTTSIETENSNDTPEQTNLRCDNTLVTNIFDNTSNSDIHQELSSQYPASPIRTESKSLEDKEVDESLNSTYREKVSNEIIQSIKEKRLREQETIITSQDTVPIITREQGFIQELFSVKILRKKNPITILSVLRSKTLLNLVTLYRKACNVEKQIQMIIDHFTKRPDIEYTDDQDNSSDDLPETEVSIPIDQDESKTRSSTFSELSEALVNTSTGTEVSEVSDTKANVNKPHSLITALSDDEPENFSDDNDDRSFCGFFDDDDRGYYYDLNTGETYTKSNRSICAY